MEEFPISIQSLLSVIIREIRGQTLHSSTPSPQPNFNLPIRLALIGIAAGQVLPADHLPAFNPPTPFIL
jgi:hypothetical protein